jgi:hypothetical protein
LAFLTIFDPHGWPNRFKAWQNPAPCAIRRSGIPTIYGTLNPARVSRRMNRAERRRDLDNPLNSFPVIFGRISAMSGA